MSSSLEIRVNQKRHLQDLLALKIKNKARVEGLDESIKRIVGEMEQEDVAWIEKIVGVKWNA